MEGKGLLNIPRACGHGEVWDHRLLREDQEANGFRDYKGTYLLTHNLIC